MHQIQQYEGKWDEFTQAYRYYGIHEQGDQIIIREWLPGAKEVYFAGEFNDWNLKQHQMKRNEFGVYTLILDKKSVNLKEGSKVKLYLLNSKDQWVYRNSAYSFYLVQDEVTKQFT